jgi:hypothetical protein
MGAIKLGEHLDYVLAEDANVCKIWARLQGGGILKKTCRLIIIDDGVHHEQGHRGLYTQEGAIEQLIIRTVSADA